MAIPDAVCRRAILEFAEQHYVTRGQKRSGEMGLRALARAAGRTPADTLTLLRQMERDGAMVRRDEGERWLLPVRTRAELQQDYQLAEQWRPARPGSRDGMRSD